MKPRRKTLLGRNSPVRTVAATLLVRLLARLSLTNARRIGAAAGWLSWRFQSRAARISAINLSRCLHIDDAKELQAATRRAMIHAGQSGAEMGAMFLWPPERVLETIERVENLALLEGAIAQDRGVVIFVPHMGNWELMGGYLAQRWELMALYRPPKEKGLEPMIKAARERMGMHTVAATQRGMVALFRRLQKGALTGILPDQQPKSRSGGIFVPFFGHAAHTPTLPARILQKTGSVAVAGAVVRSPKGFVLHFLPVEEAIYSADTETATAALNRTLERCIALAPEQYNWSYKRFKRRPKGAAKFY